MIKKALLLFFLSPLAAASQSLTFNAYTPAEGLVDTRVEKFFQDSRGVMYFLTWDGFSVFDGQRFTNYSQYQNQSLSIVSDIVEEKSGRIIIVSISGIYFLQNNKLVKDTSRHIASAKSGLIYTTNNGDKPIAGNLGLISYGQTKARPLQMKNEEGAMQPLTIDNSVLHGAFLVAASKNEKTNRRRLVLYNWKKQEKLAEIPSESEVHTVEYDNKIYAWVNWNWLELNMEAIKNGQLVLQRLSFYKNLPAEKKIINFFVDDQKNTWCITSNKEVCVTSSGTNETTCYGTVDGLPGQVIRIYQDRENNYWFAIAGKGVYKMTKSRVKKFFLPGKKDPGSIFKAMNKSPEGSIGFSASQDMYIIDGKNFSEKKMNPKTGNSQFFSWNNKAWTLYENGELQNEEGANIKLGSFDPRTKQVSSRIAFDNAGRLLLAGSNLTVINKDLSSATTELFYFTDNIACDEENNYWCFTRGGTIQGYQLQGNRLVLQKTYKETSFFARNVLHWNKDTFCIGTRNMGIVFVKINNREYRKLGNIGTEKGISNNFVTGIVRINNHKLVAANVDGLDLVQLNYPDTAVEQVFSRVGLFTGVTSIQQLNDSTVMALADNGDAYKVDVSSSALNKGNPFFYFSQVTVNGISIDPGGNNQYLYTQNNFRFSVSAPSFIDEKNIRFVFQLTGPGTNAVQNSKLADFEYSNLQPGGYTLNVTAFFPGDVPVNKTITYSFIIKKPFWKTWGFILGCIVAGLLLMYVFFKNQLQRRLHRQKIEMEKQQAIAHERSRIATDMHDDLGAGISTIKYLSQSAPYIPVEQQKQNNTKIAEQADELVDKMNDIIWAMNEKNDTLDNLVFYIKAWVANYAQQHQLQAQINIPALIEPLVIRGEKRQHIFMCVKESVHNIIKHAVAKNIWINIETGNNKLQITIRDDGKGFDVNKIIAGNGLSNMQKRIKALNGELKTVTDNGTTQQFIIPL